MKTTRLLALLWLGFAPLAPAKTDFAALFPSDTVVYAEVGDPEKLAKLPEHPVVKCLEPGRLGEFVMKALGGLWDGESMKDLEKETGLSLAELRGRLTGGLAAGAFDAKLAMKDSSIEFAVVAEYTGGEAEVGKLFTAAIRMDKESMEEDHKLMQEVHEEMKQEAKAEGEEEPEAPELEINWLQDLTREGEQTKDHSGTALHIYKMSAAAAEKRDAEWDELAWCVRDGLFFLASGEEPLRDMLDRAAARRTEGTLAGSRHHAAALAESAGSEVFLCGHLGEVMPALMQMMKEESGAETSRGPVPTPAVILGTFGFDKLRMILFGLKIEDDAMTLRAGFTHEGQPGFCKLFQLARQDPPAIFPVDARDVSWMPLDLKAAVQQAELLFESILPGWEKILTMSLARSATPLPPVDFRKEVLPHLGRGYFQVTKSYAASTAESVEESEDDVLADVKAINISNPKIEGAVFGIGVSDHKALQPALTAFMENLDKRGAKAQKRDYLQFSVHDIRSGSSPELPLVCVLTEEWLLLSVGRQELLESMLARIARPEGEHLFSRPDIVAGFKALPDDPGGSTYGDLRELAQILAYALAATLADETEETFDDTDSLLKDFKFPIHSFERSIFTENVTRSIMRIMPRSAE